MDDMNSFERLVAGEVVREIGPSRSVDAAAVFAAAVTTTQSPKWRFQSMFSATKFVVAGAIVALFGGFLLAGVLTQPSEESMPAAGTSSAEPAASAETAALVWERVEIPGETDDRHGIRLSSSGTHFIASTLSRETFSSRDGLTWSQVPVQGEVVDAYGGSLVVADGDRLSTVRIAEDADAPEERLLALDGLALPSGASLLNGSTAFGPAGLVLATCDTECMTSTVWHTADGQSWKQVYERPGELWEELIATSDGFVATTDRSGDFTVMYSGDGLVWDRIDELLRGGRYWPVGSGPFGTVLQEPLLDTRNYGRLVVVTPDGLEPLTVPAEVEARWTNSELDSWGAGGLGVVGVGIADRMVSLSTDGASWQLGTLPDTVPRLLPGYHGSGRPLLHVVEDVLLLETYACLEPDGTEVDCDESDDSGGNNEGDKQVWFRGTSSASASAPPDPKLTATTEPDPASVAEPTNANDEATTSDLLPGVDLVSEEVEPGVYRVISDGVRDLEWPAARDTLGRSLIAGLDGSVLVAENRGNRQDGGCWSRCTAFRLGSPKIKWSVEPLGPGRGPNGEDWALSPKAIGPDGTIYAGVWMPGDGASDLRAWNGSDWEVLRTRNNGGVSGTWFDENGDLWARWTASSDNGVRMGRLTADGWDPVVKGPLVDQADGIIVGGEGRPYLLRNDQILPLGPDGPGEPLAIGAPSIELRGPGYSWLSLDIDGSLWVVNGSEGELHRYDGSRTDTFDIQHQYNEGYLTWFKGDPNGGVWMATDHYHPAQGLSHFDGEAWTQFLDGLHIQGMTVAPDGNVWVLTETPDQPKAHLYVITPEAVAAAE